MKPAYSLGSHCSFSHLEVLTLDRVLNQYKLALLHIYINTSINKDANGRKKENPLINKIT
jgi:hypothetical protein